MKVRTINLPNSAGLDLEIMKRVPEDYRQILGQENGFILFDGGLHVHGAVLSPEWHSLRRAWFGDAALHRLFLGLTETDVPFGQDCLGDQFVLRGGMVHKLNAELGELEDLGMGLEAFLSKARENPVEFLKLQPLLQFKNEGGQLGPGQLLNAYPPFCTAESKRGVSLKAIEMFDRIAFLASFAKQINSVLAGSKIRIKIT